MGLVGIPFNGLPLIWRTDGNLLSWKIKSQVSLLFVMLFPRDPYLAPCYLSSLSMTYRLMSLHHELICMPMIQLWDSLSLEVRNAV